jgi:aryl-alcohol dehydrogenase-like predicted oxidoreductase
MVYQYLGNSTLRVSRLGFGCMSLGDDPDENVRILHTALDNGITFFDTADLYKQGENEITVGKAFKGHREKIILASKVGNRWNEDGKTWRWDASKRYIKQAIHASLKRLQTDYLDLYQLHGGTLQYPIEETIEAFEELKTEGLILYYGISSIRPNVIREWVKRSNMVSVMMQYSLLDRRAEESIMGLLKEHTIGVIARGPVAKGLLGNKPATHFQDYSQEEVKQVQQGLETLASPQRSKAQIALGFVLSHPAVATTIPGASKLEQLEENILASQVELSESELEKLRQVSKANVYEQHR